MTQPEALRIAQAIDEIINESNSIQDFKKSLEWLKDNIIGSVTCPKSKNSPSLN